MTTHDINPTPIQRFLHRLVEGRPLEDREPTIRIVENAGQCLQSGFVPEVRYLTEVEFYSKLISERRLKLSGPPGNARHLLWAKGRRSGASTFARHWIGLYSDPGEGAICTVNGGMGRLLMEKGINTFTARVADGTLRRRLSAVCFDEASHYPKGFVTGIDHLLGITHPNEELGIRILVTGTPSDDDRFNRLFSQGQSGFWRVRTASWEGTDTPLDDIFRYAPTLTNFHRELGYGW